MTVIGCWARASLDFPAFIIIMVIILITIIMIILIIIIIINIIIIMIKCLFSMIA